jgi:hypothetical protein
MIRGGWSHIYCVVVRYFCRQSHTIRLKAEQFNIPDQYCNPRLAITGTQKTNSGQHPALLRGSQHWKRVHSSIYLSITLPTIMIL